MAAGDRGEVPVGAADVFLRNLIIKLLLVHHPKRLIKELRGCYCPVQAGKGGSRLLGKKLVRQVDFGLALLRVYLDF